MRVVRGDLAVLLHTPKERADQQSNWTEDDDGDSDGEIRVIPALLRLFRVSFSCYQSGSLSSAASYSRARLQARFSERSSGAITIHLPHFLVFAVNVKKILEGKKKGNLPGTRGRTEWLHIRTTMCKMCRRAAPLWHRHESSFFVLSDRTKKKQWVKKCEKSHRIFPRIVCPPPFFSYSNLLCKRIKAWSRAVISCTQHKKEREGENRLTLNNESNTLQSLLHFLYFTLNIERPASPPTIPFRETEKWKLSRSRGVKTEGSLHPLFASFPETDWCCFVVLHATRPLTFCIMRTERLPTEDGLSSWTACDECWKVTAGEGGGRVLADGSAERAAPAWGAETSGGVCLLGKLWTLSGFLQLEQWLPTESEPRF